MEVLFEKSVLSREYPLPPSKSLMHRYLLAAAMAEGESRIDGLSTDALCDDLQATVKALVTLGIKIFNVEDGIHIIGKDFCSETAKTALIDCGESATALRFLIPVLLLGGGNYRLLRKGSLANRPVEIWEKIFNGRNVSLIRDGRELRLSGALTGGDFFLPGNISSQFISGLLFALPLTEEGGRIVIGEKIESRPYIEMTRAVLARANVTSEWENDHVLKVPGKQVFHGFHAFAEPDASAKAYLDTLLDYAGSKIGKTENTLQGDAVFAEILRQMKSGKEEFDLSDTPDLAPILFVCAGTLKHSTTFVGTHRLRMKESDRIETMRKELAKFGIILEAKQNSVTVFSPQILKIPCETLDAHNDHRVAMALSVLLTKTGGRLTGAECVCKSDPDFFHRLEYGGIILSQKK